MQMRTGFGVNCQDVGARVGERLEIGIRRRGHQMDVERRSAVRAQRRHDRGADRDGGHEMPVHYVYVDKIRASAVHGAHFVPQAREIRGEDGRGDANGIRHID